jgi:hypothetical protein
MALITREALVLRGVSVLGDGQPVSLRLGTGEATTQAKAVPFSMRHPSPGCDAVPTAVRHDPKANAKGNGAPGAGRSRSRAGVLVRRSPAIIAGRTFVYRWSEAEGGSKTAGQRLCRKQAKPLAPVADLSWRLSDRDSFPRQGGGQTRVPPTSHRLTAAPRTLTAASTRGRGLPVN